MISGTVTNILAKSNLGKTEYIWLTIPGYSPLLGISGKNLKVLNPIKSREKKKRKKKKSKRDSNPLVQKMVPPTVGFIFLH